MKIKKFNENADSVYDVKTDEFLDITEGRPFAFDEDFKTYIGYKGHYHSDNDNTISLNGRKRIFPGRIWLNNKILSFWVYPNRKDFLKCIKSLEKKLKINILNNNWRIEIRIKTDGERRVVDDNVTNKYLNKNSDDDEEVLIPVEEYVSSENVPEEIRKLHLMNANDKKKALSKMGYKPKYMNKKLPDGMSQVEYNNKKTKYKYTETIKIKKFTELNESYGDLEIHNKIKIYKRIIGVFVDKLPNDEIILNYINDNSDENHVMQDFLGMNMKVELDFATSSSIMDCIDIIFDGAIENDNFANYSQNDY